MVKGVAVPFGGGRGAGRSGDRRRAAPAPRFHRQGHRARAQRLRAPLSRSGFVIATSERGRLDSKAPLLEQARPEMRARLEPIVRRMRAGEPGFAKVEVEGHPFRSTVPPAQPSRLVPRRALPGGRAARRGLVAAGGAGDAGARRPRPAHPRGVALSRRLTRPLTALAASALSIARGDLEAPLPPVESRDEVGVLGQAFHDMRDSLREYIRNLQETTAAKERLEGELKVARRIQADMLPRPVAGGAGQGYELGATLVPARAVGGDLFDHFLDGSRVFFLSSATCRARASRPRSSWPARRPSSRRWPHGRPTPAPSSRG